MFDTVDDFTTNLFLDENLIDESNFDLVSINFDKAWSTLPFIKL